MADSQLLAPWEYTGEMPQVVEAGELVHKGRCLQFELLQDQPSTNRLIFRDGDDDGSWTLLHTLDSHLPLDKSLAHLRTALKEGDFLRNFWIDFDQVQIFCNGVGFWGYHDSLQQHRTDFLLGRRITQLTSSSLYHWLLSLLARPTSDAAFARRFSHCDDTQKWVRAFGLATEDQLKIARGQLHFLCSCVLYSDTALWHPESQLQWMLMNFEPAKFWLFGSSSYLLESHARLDSWADALRQFGPLRPRLNRLCLRNFFRRNSTLDRGRLASPSHHEQVEARFALQEWAQQHLPSDVWAELERFDAQ